MTPAIADQTLPAGDIAVTRKPPPVTITTFPRILFIGSPFRL